MKGQLLAIIRKELKDHLRDRRSLMSALAMPLLGPILLGAVLGVMLAWNNPDKPLTLAVSGAERAPNLVAFLERYGATVTEAPADLAAKVQEGDLEVALLIPEDYAERFNSGEAATVRLYLDNSSNKSRGTVRKAEQLLAAYGAEVARLRLMARGVSPELAQPVPVLAVDVASSGQMAGMLLNMLPYFLIMAAFMGGMHVAIDSTAGERERRSLEPLLLNPVAPGVLVLGKWLTAVAMSWLALGLCLAATLLVLGRVPTEQLGLRVDLGMAQVAGIAAAMLPVTLLTAAAQMLTATFARTFKEAQGYMQLLLLLPIVPGMFLSFNPVRPALWMMLVPTFGQQVLAQELIRGGAAGASWIIVAALGAAAAASACLYATIRLLGDERIVFGRG